MNDLLKAIIKQPENDQFRLIYADWLEEHGDPRADFIRVQIHLQNAEDRSPRWRELKQREHRLLQDHGKKWLCGVSVNTGPTADRFDRGFLSHLEIRPKTLASRIPLLREQPVVSLKLTASHVTSVPQLFTKRWFQRVRLLDCSGFRTYPKTVQSIAKAANLANLEELRTGNGDPGKTGMRALWQGELKSLKRLSLQIYSRHEDAWTELTRSNAFNQLERLEVSVPYGGEDDVDAAEVVLDGLAEACPLPKLRELHFPRFPRAVESFARFFNCVQLPALESLDFGGTPLRDTEIEAIATCTGLPALKRLNVGGAVIGNQGARVLAQSALCGRLDWLLMPFDTGRMRNDATRRALRQQFQDFEALRQGELFTGIVQRETSQTK